MPISSGSQPADAHATKRPSGCRPRFSASLASISTTAAAPSDSWLALPAGTYLPRPLTRSSLARPSVVVSGPLQSSPATDQLTNLPALARLSSHFLLVL